MELGYVAETSSNSDEQTEEDFQFLKNQLVLDQASYEDGDVQIAKNSVLQFNKDNENLKKVQMDQIEKALNLQKFENSKEETESISGQKNNAADESESESTSADSVQESEASHLIDQEDDYYEHQGFYCLVSVVEEEQNAEIVAKITTIKEHIHQLCEDLLPNSSKMGAQEIDFDSLNNKLSIQCIGICGTQPAILEYIQKSKQTEGLHQHLHNNMKEKPGLYLWVPRVDIDELITVFLILWPLPQYLQYLQRACAYTSLFRYVVEMCEDVLCVVGEKEMGEFSTENYPFVQQVNLGGVGFHWVRRTETKADIFPVEGGLRKEIVLENDIVYEESYVARCDRQPAVVSRRVLPQRMIPKNFTKFVTIDYCFSFFKYYLSKYKIVFEDRILNQLSRGDIYGLKNNPLVSFIKHAEQNLYAEFWNIIQQAQEIRNNNSKVDIKEIVQKENQLKIEQFQRFIEFCVNEFLNIESNNVLKHRRENLNKIEEQKQAVQGIQKQVKCQICSEEFVAKSEDLREPIVLKCQDICCRDCATAASKNQSKKCPQCKTGNYVPEQFEACLKTYQLLDVLKQSRDGLKKMFEKFENEVDIMKLKEIEEFEVLKNQFVSSQLKFGKKDVNMEFLQVIQTVQGEMEKSLLQACVLKQYHKQKLQDYSQHSIKELTLAIFDKSFKVNESQSILGAAVETVAGWFSIFSPKKETTWEAQIESFRWQLNLPESQISQILNELIKIEVTFQLTKKYQNILNKKRYLWKREQQIRKDQNKPVTQIPDIREKLDCFKSNLISVCAHNKDLPEVKIISIENSHNNQFRIEYKEQVSVPGNCEYSIQTFQPVKNGDQSNLKPLKIGPIMILPNYEVVLLCPVVDGNSTKFIVVLCGKNSDGTEVHVTHKHLWYRIEERSFKRRLKGQFSQVTYDTQLKLLYLFNESSGVLETFEFEKDYGQLLFVLKDDLLGSTLKNITQIISIPGKKELLLAANEGIFIYRVKTRTFRSGSIPLKSCSEHLMVTPDGSMLMSLYYDDQKWLYDVYSLSPLVEGIKEKHQFDGFDDLIVQEASFWMIEVLGKSYIYGCSSKENNVMVKCVEIQINSLTQKNILTPEAAEEMENKRAIKHCEANSLFDYIYYIFEKFPGRAATGSVPTPTNLRILVPTGTLEQTVQDINNYILKIWKEVRDNTRKDFTGVELHWTVLDSSNFHVESLTCSESFGDWLIRFICLVPIQICRCEEHTLIPLSDNQFLEIDRETTNIEEIAETISFGLYDSIFRSTQCCNLPTVVVSSMGLQSTGKSYQLCHLGGCLFDVSGSRCTDGCWMTVRIVDHKKSGKKLMVFLDFEGLGSQERHESEDMLLSLFSGAVSHLTMFKTDLDFNRDVEKTLRRFNLGAPKVKSMCGTSINQVFTGSFMFCLKDVQNIAVSESIKEFKRKIQRMVDENDNFLNSMYSGEVRIVDFAYLENEQYYRQLNHVADNFVLNQKWLEKRGLSTSQQFLHLIKMLLAKISNKDWTPLDRNQIRQRMEILNRNFDSACQYGCTGVTDEGTLENALDLLDYDTQTPIHIKNDIYIELQLPLLAVNDMSNMYEENKELLQYQIQNINEQNVRLKISILDKQLFFGDPSKVHIVSDTGKKIAQLFSNIFKIDTSLFEQKDYDLWRAAQEKFTKTLIERRQQHVKTWIQKNTKHFAEDSEATQWSVRLDSFFVPLLQNTKLCTNKCKECFLPCQLAIVHEGEHDCSTDHKCHLECKYCEDIDDAEVYCCETAGHPGPHTCGSQKHQCGQLCCLSSGSRNCAMKCVQLPGHDGDHKCGSTAHLCSHKCDLNICQEFCKVEYGVEHNRHECSMGGCPETCQLCNRRCASKNHFHGELQDAVHLCEITHKCIDPNTNQQKLCSCDGVCVVDSTIIKENRLFDGEREQFMYEHRTQQSIKRKPCVKTIPVGQLFHEGPCVCSTDAKKVHFCGHPCPSCKYLCTEPYGHPGRHNTQHGNMINSIFISDEDDIDFDGHKYRRGEQSTPILCDLSCISKGRHIHTINCIKERCSSNNFFDGHRHSDVEYSDGINKIQVDELTHDAYYELIDFKDPCPESYQQQFRLCPATCGSQQHDNETDQDGNPVVMRCKLPLWHPPIINGIIPADQAGGYVSLNGHYFPCQHVGGYNRCSTYLIIDRSGSMSSKEVRPLSPQIQNHPNFVHHSDNKKYLENCLGLVYETVMNFVSERNNMCSEDVVSFVPFNNTGQVVISEILVSESHVLLNQMLNTYPGGGTNFCSGLKAAYDHLVQKRQNNSNQIFRQPVFIILSDSMDHTKEQFLQFLQQVMDKEQNEQGGLTVHALGFGNYVDERFLEQITDIGKGGYRVVGMQNSQQMINDLSQAFTSIAEKPSSHIGFINLNR